jgi:hypothetical protein
MAATTTPNPILRGTVAALCAAVFTLILAGTWIGLEAVTLPELEEAAATDRSALLSYAFWSAVHHSVPYWLGAVWITAVGTFFQTGEAFRLVRDAIWLVPAAICVAGLLAGAGVGSDQHFLVHAGAMAEHLASAEVVSR